MPNRPPTYRPFGHMPAKQVQKQSRERRRETIKLYKSARWSQARRNFLSQNPRCVDCGRLFDLTDLDLDHEIPHRGNYELFWDVNNWRTRCHSCHSKKTARGL